MILLSHLTGSPNSRQAALAYQEAKALCACHHTLAWTDPPGLPAALPPALRAALQRRQFPAALAPFLHTHPFPEYLRLLARGITLPLLAPLARRLSSIPAANRRFDRAVARSLQSSDCRAVHGFFDTSLHTFREARRLGLRRIYELPTPYWRTVQHIIADEPARRPGSDWNATLPNPAAFATTAAQRDEELQLADLILVPSAFVRDSLSEAPQFKAPVVILPYGCPAPPSPLPTHNSPLPISHLTTHHSPLTTHNSQLTTHNSPLPTHNSPLPTHNSPSTTYNSPLTTHNSHLSSSAAKPPLRLLFAGTLSQSKGLADLLDALEPLGDRVTLTLAGSASGPLPEALRSPHPRRQLLGQLPHAVLLNEMRRHDLLVLPTLYEGLSLVALEALSQGLPVLTTTHAGFSGLVENGRHLLLTPPSDPAALRAQLETLLTQPETLPRLSAEGQSWALHHSWTHYRQALLTTVLPLIQS